MRIMGKSPVDSGKYIVEIDEKELAILNKTSLPTQPNQPNQRQKDANIFKDINHKTSDETERLLRDLEFENRDLFGNDGDESNEFFEQEDNGQISSSELTDHILDSYIDKKISKEQMISEINKIQGR